MLGLDQRCQSNIHSDKMYIESLIFVLQKKRFCNFLFGHYECSIGKADYDPNQKITVCKQCLHVKKRIYFYDTSCT